MLNADVLPAKMGVAGDATVYGPIVRQLPKDLYRVIIGIVLILSLCGGSPGEALSDCGTLTKAADDHFAKAQEHQAEGRYQEAVEALKQALSIDMDCRPANAHLEFVALATASEAMGDFNTALDTYRQDLFLATKIFGTDSPDTAVAYSNLGKINQAMGNLSEAVENMEKALDIFVRKSGPDQPDTSVAYNNAGSLYEAAGDYGKALEYYEKSLTIRLKVFGAGHPATATAYNNLGAIYQSLGRHERALENLEKALTAYVKSRGAEHPSTATAYNNIGSVYKSMNLYPRALEYYGKNLEVELRVFGPDHPSTAVAYNNIASVYECMEDFAKALESYRKALSIFQNTFGPNHPATARAYNNIGSVYLSMGRYPEAHENYRKALPTAQSSRDAHLEWNVLAGMSTTLSGLGHPGVAILVGKQAVNAIQAMRSTLTSLNKSFQKSFMTDKERVYKRLASLLVDSGRIPEAQRVLDLLKEEEFFDYVRGADGSEQIETVAYSETEQPWAEQFARISGNIAQRGAEFAEIRRKAKSGELTEEDRKKEKEILSDLEAASRSFEAFLEKTATEFEKTSGEKAAELTEKGLRDLKSLQSTLRFLNKCGTGPPGCRSETVVVYYLVTDKKLIIILTTSETQLAREVEVSSTELNRMVSSLRKDLSSPSKDPRPASRRLYEKVLAPISRDLEQSSAKTLMLALDGALRYVPFSCLHDGEKYLIERYTSVVFTPASRDKLRVPPVPSWSVAGFGVSEKVSDRFKALPSVRDELNSIVRKDGNGGIMPGIVKLDQEFTLDAMREALLQEYQVVHIASHFVFNPTDKDSFLLLGDGSQLTLDKIKHQGFRFDEVDLLTLSACETGLSSQEANGREVEGFGVLAQRSGAKGVIASLWPVADVSTGILMKNMYELRSKAPATNKAECLRQAQLEMLRGQEEQRRPSSTPRGLELAAPKNDAVRAESPSSEAATPMDYSHPFYWAPFILMGNFL